MTRSRRAAIIAAAAGGTALAAGALVKAAVPGVTDDLRQIIVATRLSREYRNKTVVDLLEQQARNKPNQTYLIFEGKGYTFKNADEWSNRVARVYHRLGVARGDRVALLMRNEPTFLWLLFGLFKLGATVTLLNSNLRLQSLLHCIAAAGCRFLVTSKDADLLSAVNDISDELRSSNVRLMAYVEGSSPQGFERAVADDVANESGEPLPHSIRAKVLPTDLACHIFTSGTTGLPKPAIILHARLLPAFVIGSIVVGISERDVLYSPLPLYHSAALVFVICALHNGCSMVLGRKFSAKHFWDDCRKHNVTVVQYIGELCRFLLATPERPDDSRHHVRLAFGNGLRRDIWMDFKKRFNIGQICEWYAASEGIFAFMNLTGTVGSCGRLSPLMRAMFNIYGIKYDLENDVVVRDADGMCCLAAPGEPALYVAQVTESRPFMGYEGDKSLNEKKLLRDVLKKGDVYYNSGDIFIRDKDCNMFFVDRVGDTFRWNGENVSTIEVGNILCKHSSVQDAIVYGVQVPGHEGRAGMAALCLQAGVNVDEELLQTLYKHVSVYLPSYAQPFFLRFLDEPPLTGTFKYSAVTLKKEGFDPRSAGTRVYFKSRARGTYTAIDDDLLAQLNRGVLDVHSSAGRMLVSRL